MLDDRSDVRSATVAEGATADSSIEYRSLVAVPFDDDGVLLAASVSQAEFADTDIDTLRMISAFAMITRDLLGAYTSQPSDFDHAESAGEILTHDAANFLSILQARLELAREDPREEHFDAIEKASRRLEELIDDTATMLLHGSREIELEHLDLDSVIQEAWNGIETRDATLVPGKFGRIAADRSSVLELLENLFRNAVEHAGPNSIVRTGLLDTDDGFYVEDDGPGMPALEAAWISDSDSEPAHMLDGVGLSIVKRIIDAHGWDISAGVSDSGGARLEIRNVDIVE